jgi:type IX secretion system PorP/SprF family membrane protein
MKHLMKYDKTSNKGLNTPKTINCCHRMICAWYRCKLFLLWLMVLIPGSLISQDIHFSQYNASPLNLNPALTGFYNDDYRVTLNYRGQWGSFTTPYRTMGGAFEYSPLKGKIKYDNFCAGLMVYNDVAGDARYGSNAITLSSAFRKQLGSVITHTLSLGIQIGMLQQRIQFKDLQFDNQFNGIEYDENIPPNELLNKTSNFVPDLATGLLWQVISKESFNFYAGAAYYHILQPKITLLDASNYRLPSRIVGHAGAYIYLNRLMNLLPSAAYMKQAGAWQVNAGTYLQFILDDWNDKHTAFAIGVWGRVASPVMDAIIAGARLDFQGFILAFSYDFNTSRLSNVSNVRGAYELSLIYTGHFTSKSKRRFSIPCPQL